MPGRARSISPTVQALGLGLLLLCCALVRAQSGSAEQRVLAEAKFKIAGMIVNSLNGAPLGKARVSLADTRKRDAAVSMITTEDGRFAFDSLPQGKFALEGEKRGFLAAAYQQHEQFSTAIVTGAGLNTENLTLRLTPMALLSGRVVDESGDVVRNAELMLYVESHQGGVHRIGRRGYAATDDEGYYEFAGLAPGNYYVSVAAKPWYAVHPSSTYVDGVGDFASGVNRSLDVAYPRTFYNGATDSDGATPIAVGGGDHITADIHLVPVPALHLFIHAPEGLRGFNMPEIQKRVFDHSEPVETEARGQVAPGVFEVVGIPAGKYSVDSRMTPSGRVAATAEMNLTKDGEVLDAGSSEPAGTLKVTARMARGEPIPRGLNLALRNAKMQLVAFMPLEANGEVTFDEVPPGKYALLVYSPPPRYTIARIASQGVETAEHDVNVTAGASLELRASLVAGVVGVAGFAKRGGRPMSGVMVALVPKDPESHPERFRRDQTDTDGSFEMLGVLPGVYTIIAVEDAWDSPWMQPGALAKYVQHGQNLTIGELMQGSVELPDPVEVQRR
jgi:protocatechuate 3,4-dioxygenase beta subunit